MAEIPQSDKQQLLIQITDVPQLQHEETTPQCAKATNEMTSTSRAGTSMLPTPNQKFEIAKSYKENWTELVQQPTVRATTSTNTDEKDELYFADAQTPRRIYCMIKIKRISDVDNAEQTFRCKFHIYFDWLLSQKEYESYVQTKPGTNWIPSFVPNYDFTNIVEANVNEPVDYGGKGPYRVQKISDFQQDIVGFDPCHAYFCRMRVEVDATFQETYELETYPFDCQDLTIVIREMSGTSKAVLVPELRTLEDGNPSDFAALDGSLSTFDAYELENCIVQFGESDAAGSKSKTVYSEMLVSIKVSRKWESVLVDTLLVIFLVCVLSFAGFAIPFEDVGDRLAFTLTLMLTAVLFDTKNNPTPYLTLMDKYVLSSYVYLTLMMIENALGGWYDTDVDQMFFYIFIGLFTVMNIYFVVNAITVASRERAKLEMSHAEVTRYNNRMRSVETKHFKFSWNELYHQIKGDKTWIAFKPKIIDHD